MTSAMSAFGRVGIHAVTVIYTGGTVAHVLRLALRFSWRDFPFVIDWLLVGLGTLGFAALVACRRRIDYRGRWELVVHWLIVVHLGASVLVHVWILAVRSHAVLAPFPYGYSWFALAYFAFFAWRSWTLRWLPEPA